MLCGALCSLCTEQPPAQPWRDPQPGGWGGHSPTEGVCLQGWAAGAGGKARPSPAAAWRDRRCRCWAKYSPRPREEILLNYGCGCNKPPLINREEGEGSSWGTQASVAGTAGLAGDPATLGLESLPGPAVARWLPAMPLLLLRRSQPLEGAESHVRWGQAVPRQHRQAPAAAGQWPWGHLL